ncbi:hypothetical protein HK105_207717 [Polyrhizophydium stewartii]|uniref:Uncharacterized protein n=1 Tax=Polyrhizophydium stewartii TaxID=2732419 RepID=A0ABR4MZZ1_9FUNG
MAGSSTSAAAAWAAALKALSDPLVWSGEQARPEAQLEAFAQDHPWKPAAAHAGVGEQVADDLRSLVAWVAQHEGPDAAASLRGDSAAAAGASGGGGGGGGGAGVPAVRGAHGQRTLVAALELLVPAADPQRAFAHLFDSVLWPLATLGDVPMDVRGGAARVVAALLRAEARAAVPAPAGPSAAAMAAAAAAVAGPPAAVPMARRMLRMCIERADRWLGDLARLGGDGHAGGADQSEDEAHAGHDRARRVLVELGGDAFQSRTLPVLERVLFDFGMDQPHVFYALLNELALSPATRLRALMLLKTFLVLEGAPTYYLIEAPLLETVMGASLVDTDAATLLTAVAILTVMLPIMSARAVPRIDGLIQVLVRMMQWELTFPAVLRMLDEAEAALALREQGAAGGAPAAIKGAELSAGAQLPLPLPLPATAKAALAVFTVDAARRVIDNLYTVVYGMFPANVIGRLQQILAPGSTLLERMLAQTRDADRPRLAAVADPLAPLRRRAYDEVEMDEDERIKARITRLARDHRLHPDIITTTVARELQEPWFVRLEASEVMVRCMGLRADSHATPVAPPPMPMPPPTSADPAGSDPAEENLRACIRQVALMDRTLHAHMADWRGPLASRPDGDSDASEAADAVPAGPAASSVLGRDGAELLRLHYFVLMNESFFKECMRQYHMMHIRQLRKMVYDKGFQEASVQNLHIRFKHQTLELTATRKAVGQMRRDEARMVDIHRKTKHEVERSNKEARHAVRQMQEQMQALQDASERLAAEREELVRRVAECERVISAQESLLLLARQEREKLREYEAAVPELQARVLAEQSAASTTAGLLDGAGPFKAAGAGAGSAAGEAALAAAGEQLADFAARIKILQDLLDATERERATLVHERQERAVMWDQLDLKSREVARLEALAKEQASQMHALQMQMQIRLEAQEAKYASLRKIYLLMQGQLVAQLGRAAAASASAAETAAEEP